MAKRILTCTGLALALGWALGAATAPAAEPVLNLVPPDALGFGVVKNLEATDEAIVGLGKRMQLPIPSPLTLIKARANITAGLDEKGDGLVVAFADEDTDRPPVFVLFAPVSDYAEFIGQFEPEDAKAKITEVTILKAGFLVGEKGGYAVLAEPKHRRVLKAVLENDKGPAPELKSLGPWLDENDVSLVITRPGVELITAKIREGLRQARDVFTTLENLGEDEQAAQGIEMVKLAFGMYEELATAAGKEVAAISHGVKLDDDGALVIRGRLQVVAGGNLARAMRSVKLPAANLLAGVPAGPYVLAGAGAIPEGLVEPMVEFSAAIIRAAPEIYGVPADKATASMKGFRGMSMSMGTGKPGDPIYGNLAGAIFVDDADAYLDTYRKSIDAIRKLVGENEKSVFSAMKVKEVEIDGKKALRLQMSFAGVFPMDANPEMARLFEAMYGPGGKMSFLMAVAGKKTVAFGSTEELLKAALQCAGGAEGLAADEQLKKTAAAAGRGPMGRLLEPPGHGRTREPGDPRPGPARSRAVQAPGLPRNAPGRLRGQGVRRPDRRASSRAAQASRVDSGLFPPGADEPNAAATATGRAGGDLIRGRDGWLGSLAPAPTPGRPPCAR